MSIFFQAVLRGQEVRLGEKQVFMLEGVEESQGRKTAESEADSIIKFWKRRHSLEKPKRYKLS